MRFCFLELTLELGALFTSCFVLPPLSPSFSSFLSLFCSLLHTQRQNQSLAFLSVPPSSRCFIPNIYAALCTAVLVPLICLVAVLVVFIHAYQVTQQWKAYDDIYRGRTNSTGTQQIRKYTNKYTNTLYTWVWFWEGSNYILRFR